MAVVAPSQGLANFARLERGLAALRSMRWIPIVADSASREIDGIAASAERRAAELEAAFLDDEVEAVFTIYGGYNTNELLPLIDWSIFAKHPKILCGYSDTTTLLLAAFARCGVCTFHGPAVLPELGDPDGVEPYTRASLKAIMEGFEGSLPLASAESWHDEHRCWGTPAETRRPQRQAGGWRWLRGGDVRGVLVGGHLESMEVMVGTGFLPSLEGRVLFWDAFETDDRRFRRSVTHLRQAGVLDDVAGVVLGRMARTPAEAVRRIETWLPSQFAENVPIVTGVDLGHTDPMLTLPIGGVVELASARDAIVISESTVERGHS